MPSTQPSVLREILGKIVGRDDAANALSSLEIDIYVAAERGERASRGVVAMALNVLLFQNLLARVPTGRDYVRDVRAAGRRVQFDHGALRTIDFGDRATGAVPAGHLAFKRILEPLGYRVAEVYPLDRLGMTGYAFAHADLPETIPQFFVSELHVQRFSPAFAAAAERVFGGTTDAIDAEAAALLDEIAATGELDLDKAAALIVTLAAAFSRHHPVPSLADYELLIAESAEAAWIATEGNAFNHATDRVPDLDALVGGQTQLGRPMKPAIEVSGSGRVRQTAFRADPVERRFTLADGSETSRTVPGSFYEFIERARMGDGRLDLAFDSSNAQGIFKMTAAA